MDYFGQKERSEEREEKYERDGEKGGAELVLIRTMTEKREREEKKGVI